MYNSSGCNYNYVQFATSSASFFFSLLGVILDIIFICRIKTNFMIRSFVYFMVATTMELGAACPRSLFTINVIRQSCTSIYYSLGNFTDLFFILIAVYCLWVQLITVCSIDVTLMTLIYKYTCGATSSTTTQCHAIGKLLEKPKPEMHGSILFGSPLWSTCGHHYNYSSIIYNRELKLDLVCIQLCLEFMFIYSIIIVIIPVLFNLLCNISLIVVLPVWFFWLRRRQVARVRTRTVLKETGLFVLLLFST